MSPSENVAKGVSLSVDDLKTIDNVLSVAERIQKGGFIQHPGQVNIFPALAWLVAEVVEVLVVVTEDEAVPTFQAGNLEAQVDIYRKFLAQKDIKNKKNSVELIADLRKKIKTEQSKLKG